MQASTPLTVAALTFSSRTHLLIVLYNVNRMRNYQQPFELKMC